jgi:hypothetical protein
MEFIIIIVIIIIIIIIIRHQEPCSINILSLSVMLCVPTPRCGQDAVRACHLSALLPSGAVM